MSHMSRNIPFTTFHGFIFSELPRITKCTLRSNGFIPRASYLFSRMIVQGGNSKTVTKQRKKTFYCYLTVFQKFGKSYEEINISIMKNI